MQPSSIAPLCKLNPQSKEARERLDKLSKSSQ